MRWDKTEATAEPVKYRSSAMQIDSCDDCLVCRFVDGDRSEEVLLETIRILDANLAKSEHAFELLQQQLVKLVAKRN